VSWNTDLYRLVRTIQDEYGTEFEDSAENYCEAIVKVVREGL
jgi:hypothetical protein